ncbi:MAG TPA: nitroreductase family protein [Rhizomicrobium sp.]|nr:nitroreductase family protein [Rhizomicrobium sp.]
MDTITAIHTRRSVRSYAARVPERGVVEDILHDAAQAPTTPVSGAWLFTVIAGAARLADFGERAKRHAREHRPSAEGYGWADRPEFSVFLGAPLAIVISAPADNGQSIQDCNRAGQNLMLSAHARGLGTCWIGSPMLWLRDAAVKAELAIPPAHAPFAAFALGYPSGTPTGEPRARPQIVWS